MILGINSKGKGGVDCKVDELLSINWKIALLSQREAS